MPALKTEMKATSEKTCERRTSDGGNPSSVKAALSKASSTDSSADVLAEMQKLSLSEKTAATQSEDVEDVTHAIEKLNCSGKDEKLPEVHDDHDDGESDKDDEEEEEFRTRGPINGIITHHASHINPYGYDIYQGLPDTFYTEGPERQPGVKSSAPLDYAQMGKARRPLEMHTMNQAQLSGGSSMVYGNQPQPTTLLDPDLPDVFDSGEMEQMLNNIANNFATPVPVENNMPQQTALQDPSIAQRQKLTAKRFHKDDYKQMYSPDSGMGGSPEPQDGSGMGGSPEPQDGSPSDSPVGSPHDSQYFSDCASPAGDDSGATPRHRASPELQQLPTRQYQQLSSPARPPAPCPPHNAPYTQMPLLEPNLNILESPDTSKQEDIVNWLKCPQVPYPSNIPGEFTYEDVEQVINLDTTSQNLSKEEISHDPALDAKFCDALDLIAHDPITTKAPMLGSPAQSPASSSQACYSPPVSTTVQPTYMTFPPARNLHNPAPHNPHPMTPAGQNQPKPMIQASPNPHPMQNQAVMQNPHMMPTPQSVLPNSQPIVGNPAMAPGSAMAATTLASVLPSQTAVVFSQGIPLQTQPQIIIPFTTMGIPTQSTQRPLLPSQRPILPKPTTGPTGTNLTMSAWQSKYQVAKGDPLRIVAIDLQQLQRESFTQMRKTDGLSIEDLLKPDEEGDTRLAVASMHGMNNQVYAEVRRLKLDNKLKELINKPSFSGQTPLYYAVYFNQAETAALLLHYEADPDIMIYSQSSQRYLTPLHCAARSGDSHLRTMQVLLASNANVNQLSNGNKTALHVAAESHGKVSTNEETKKTSVISSKEIILTLIHNGADLNAKDIAGHTPLHSIIKTGDVSLISDVLSSLDNSVSSLALQQENGQGDSGLHILAKVNISVNDMRNLVDLLLTKGASVTQRNRANRLAKDLFGQQHSEVHGLLQRKYRVASNKRH